jgi:hypothetical protein
VRSFYVVRSSRAAITSAARRQLRVGCADDCADYGPGGPHHERAANTSAARRQLRVGCADDCADGVSRKEAKTQREQGWVKCCCRILVRSRICGEVLLRGAVHLRGEVLPGRKYERSEASIARGLRVGCADYGPGGPHHDCADYGPGGPHHDCADYGPGGPHHERDRTTRGTAPRKGPHHERTAPREDHSTSRRLNP